MPPTERARTSLVVERWRVLTARAKPVSCPIGSRWRPCACEAQAGGVASGGLTAAVAAAPRHEHAQRPSRRRAPARHVGFRGFSAGGVKRVT